MNKYKNCSRSLEDPKKVPQNFNSLITQIITWRFKAMNIIGKDQSLDCKSTEKSIKKKLMRFDAYFIA